MELPADEEKLLANAINQFNVVLQFFPRADAKMSTLLGINIGMLAFLGTNVPPFQQWTLALWIACPLALVLMGISLLYVYKSSYPAIIADKRSLIFFNDIAAYGEDDFIAKFRQEFLKDYTDDMLRQIWCNSEILRERFHHLQQGYKALALAVAPWLLTLMFSANLTHALKF